MSSYKTCAKEILNVYFATTVRFHLSNERICKESVASLHFKRKEYEDAFNLCTLRNIFVVCVEVTFAPAMEVLSSTLLK
jgi:hypothetical protein